MPRGIPAKSTVACRKCAGSQFTSISELRRHQWERHPEMFHNLQKAAQKALRHPAVRKQRAEAVKRYHKARRKALLPLAPALNGDMRVSELLVELQSQQRFMNDVVALISGILARRAAAQEGQP